MTVTGPVRDEMAAAATQAESATGREMRVDNVSLTARRTSVPEEFDVVTFQFEWEGFAGTDDDRLRRGPSDLAGDRGAFGPAFYTNVSLMVDDYNDGAEPSGFVASRLTGEVVNLHVTAPSDRTVVSFAIGGDGRLDEVRAGARDDASLRLTTDRATMREIMSADDPQSALLDAIDRGDVQFRGLGIANRVKWFAFGLLKGVADTVRGLADFVRGLS